MKQKRTFRFKVASILALTLISFTCLNYTTYAQPTYNKAYTIENVLSDYEYFIREDLTATNSGHCVSAIAVGGTLDTPNTVGDAQVAASYVKYIKRLGGFEQGKWLTGSAYDTYKVPEFYYDTVDASVPSWLAERLTHSPSYIDFDKAFTELEDQSVAWSNLGTSAYSINSGTLTLTLAPAKDTYITIPYNAITTTSSIVIEGLSSVQDFVDYKYIISITGVESTDFTLSFYNINMNGKSFSQALKDLQGGTNGAQINLEGMKLVWNFPDATGNLTAQGLSGHLVAPQADVSLEGGNFEGGIIAKNVKKSDAEGHFYPFYKPGVTPEPSPTSSPEPTSSPSPSSTSGPNNTSTPTAPDNNTTSNSTSPGDANSYLLGANTNLDGQANSNTQDNASPKTGENHSTTIFLIIILISGVGLLSIKKQSKKHTN